MSACIDASKPPPYRARCLGVSPCIPLPCPWHLSSNGTIGLVAMTSASHAEGRQLDPGRVYFRPCMSGPGLPNRGTPRKIDGNLRKSNEIRRGSPTKCTRIDDTPMRS
jgi:hypothetical protein